MVINIICIIFFKNSFKEYSLQIACLVLVKVSCYYLKTAEIKFCCNLESLGRHSPCNRDILRDNKCRINSSLFMFFTVVDSTVGKTHG